MNEEQSCCNSPSCCGTDSTFVRSYDKVGRNNPCPCGSRVKFKRCCGK